MMLNKGLYERFWEILNARVRNEKLVLDLVNDVKTLKVFEKVNDILTEECF